ncbi:alpha/beta-hydrolase [Hesseltinella vesiculosa]|uniref:Alpha/beta-hydrolase n=1 Tax=Hesseltinella vesiculosa TaxID=101127 RepID=A0A1X2GSZ7_9FUNG|nr:alpha/beta-hydrolase [Hesseltinella vesiculosa]
MGISLLPTPVLAQQVAVAAYFAQLSAIAYCPSVYADQQWTLTMCTSALPDGQLQTTFHGGLHDTTGYVVTSVSEKTIFVAFRGTNTLPQLITDLELSLMTYPPVPSAGVETGFYDSYLEVQNIVVSTVANLLQQHPDYVVKVTGHSLGAAQASIATLDLYQRLDSISPRNIALYTYGEPRVGDKNFSAYITSTGITHVRVVHHADVITYLPLVSQGYLHAGEEYWITDVLGDTTERCESAFESPYCSNRLVLEGNLADHLL